MNDILNRLEQEIIKIEEKEEQSLDDYTLHNVLIDAKKEIFNLRNQPKVTMNVSASGQGRVIGEVHGGMVINK